MQLFPNIECKIHSHNLKFGNEAIIYLLLFIFQLQIHDFYLLDKVVF